MWHVLHCLSKKNKIKLGILETRKWRSVPQSTESPTSIVYRLFTEDVLLPCFSGMSFSKHVLSTLSIQAGKESSLSLPTSLFHIFIFMSPSSVPVFLSIQISLKKAPVFHFISSSLWGLTCQWVHRQMDELESFCFDFYMKLTITQII